MFCLNSQCIFFVKESLNLYCDIDVVCYSTVYNSFENWYTLHTFDYYILYFYNPKRFGFNYFVTKKFLVNFYRYSRLIKYNLLQKDMTKSYLKIYSTSQNIFTAFNPFLIYTKKNCQTFKSHFIPSSHLIHMFSSTKLHNIAI